MLVRTVSCVHGSVELQVDCEPAFDYGARAGGVGVRGGTATTVRSAGAPGSELELRLTTDLRLGFEGARARARTTLREGDRAFAASAWSEHPLPAASPRPSGTGAYGAILARVAVAEGGSRIIRGASTSSAAR